MSAYREAWRLAWPLMLSNVSTPLLGIVDTAVVGHLSSPHYLGAVALGAVVLSVVYFVFGFLRMGTTGSDRAGVRPRRRLPSASPGSRAASCARSASRSCSACWRAR